MHCYIYNQLDRIRYVSQNVKKYNLIFASGKYRCKPDLCIIKATMFSSFPPAKIIQTSHFSCEF